MSAEERIEHLVADARITALPLPDERRRIRVRAGITQHVLADALGVTRPALTRWESGSRTPRGSLRREYALALTRLADAFGDLPDQAQR